MKGVPNDQSAEEALLGSMLVSKRAIEDVHRMVDPVDFYKPAHAHIAAAIFGLYAVGAAVDAVSVAALLNDQGTMGAAGGPGALVSLITAPPSASAATSYAMRVVEMSNRRRVMRAGSEATRSVIDGADATEAAEAAILAMSNLGTADLTVPVTDVVTFEEWLDSGEQHASRWVIPGMLRSEWRMILTAPAGVGKATLMRQIAYASSVGIHPFSFKTIPPVRSLYVDLENPVSAVMETGKRMIKIANQIATLDRAPAEECLVWSRQSGINLRSRRDRTELERRIVQSRPDLVCIGPVYKTYAKDSRLSAEEVTMEVTDVLDDLRTRYDFALILEHHSPRGSIELFPFGSTVWERWPECGKTLRASEDDPKRIILGSYRPDRVPIVWPTTFQWGDERKGEWPFTATYH